MTRHVNIRGATPVGQLTDLDPMEQAAVLCLRLWSDGPRGQAQIHRDLAEALGPGAGNGAATALDDLCALVACHGRRPLMRHQHGCRCLGGDEACFASLVALAVEGDREDALLMAMLLVRPDIAPPLVAAAQTFGLSLRRMALKARDGMEPAASRKLH